MTQIRLNITSDEIRPLLQRMRDLGQSPAPVLEAGALTIQMLAQNAFEDPALRPLPWAPRKRGSNPLLKKTRALQQSIRVATVTDTYAVVGTDRPSAAVHQFGTGPYVIRPKHKRALWWPGANHPVARVNHPGLPPRPFFPIDAAGHFTPEAQRRVLKNMQRKLDTLFQ